MPVRTATPDDLDRLTGMAERFFGLTGYAAYLSFDPQATRTTLSTLLGREDAAILVLERDGAVTGAVGGLIASPVFSTEGVMQELFWWAEEEHRGRSGPLLFTALRRWASERGARVMVMAALEACDGDRVARLYHRAGLVSLERTFIGAL